MSSLTKFHGLENLKNATEQELEIALQELMGGIKALNQEALAGMKSRVDAKIKPLGSLGVLEDIAQQLAGIFGTTHPKSIKSSPAYGRRSWCCRRRRQCCTSGNHETNVL